MASNNIRELIHALRNPLTAILSNLELLTEDMTELDDETKEMLGEIKFNSKYLNTLMKNAGDVEKIKSLIDISVLEVNINDILIGIINQLKIINPEINNHITIECDNKITFLFEADMIMRFFFVIIYELLKFTSPQKKLFIQIKKINSALEIQLSFSKNNEKGILTPEKIFKELFIQPEQKHNKLLFNYFQKVLFLFKGTIKINKEKNIPVLFISFTEK